MTAASLGRRIFLSVSCTLLLCTAGIATAAEVKFATFNAEFLTRPRIHVKFGLPFDLAEATPADQAQWQNQAFRDSKFAEAVEHVADAIVRINADVLALQEVGNQQDVDQLAAAVLAKGLNYPHRALCQCTDTFTTQHVAVFSKLPIAETLPQIAGREMYDRELDDDDTEADTGVSKGMRVKLNAQGREVFLYVAHLTSERGGHDADEQRIAQASIIRRHYLPLLNEGKDIIVAGDLNDHRGQPAIKRIRGRDDIWDDLLETGEAPFFDQAQLGTRWTYEFMGVRSQLDHILVSRSLRTNSSSVRAETIDVGDPLASDHRSFIVRINLP